METLQCRLSPSEATLLRLMVHTSNSSGFVRRGYWIEPGPSSFGDLSSSPKSSDRSWQEKENKIYIIRMTTRSLCQPVVATNKCGPVKGYLCQKIITGIYHGGPCFDASR